MKVLTIWQMKGGVGKTTIAFNLATNMAKRNIRTLCIDLDIQSDLTSFFETELKSTKKSKPDIMECLDKGISLKRAVYSSRFKNLKFVRGSYGVAANPSDITILKALLEEVNSQFDVVIIDCHPDNTVLSENAIVAADLVLTPIELDEFSKNNLNLVVIELNKVANMVGKDDIYQKVLVNRLKRTKDQFLHFSDLINNHDYPVLPVSISERAAINTALTLHKPMYMHRKNCIATRDFEDVTELLMTTLGIKGRRI